MQSPASAIPNQDDEYPYEPDRSRSYVSQAKSKLQSISGETIGVGLLIAAQLGNSIMTVSCKLLITDTEFDTKIHPIQILFVRMTITYVLCLLYMRITRSVPDGPFGKPEFRIWLILRGIVGFMGVFGLYFSLMYLSISDAIAITFLIPLFTAFLAFVLLHERYSLLEAICSLISLGGVMLIARPNFIFGEQDNDASGTDEAVESSSTEKRLLSSGVGLLGVVGASLVYIVLRKIGTNAHPLISVSYYALACIIVSSICIIAIPSISFAIPQNLYQWFLFITIGVTGFWFQFALTAGIQRVKASKASLVVYTQVIFALFWDVVIWNHFPGVLSILGIVVIVICTGIVMKYKSTDNMPTDIEQQGYQNVSTDERPGDKPEEFQLQDFIIGDDSDHDHDENDANLQGNQLEPVSSELNSVQYSYANSIKLNQ